MAKTKLSYWQRRQVQNMYRYMQGAEETADQIFKLYLKASRYLALQSDEIFEKLMTKHSLTEKEARQLISTMQNKASLDELLQKLKNSSDESKKDLLVKLESPAYQARLERLQQLQNRLDQVMSSVYGEEKAVSTSFYTELANESYYQPVFDIQQQVGAAFSFNRVDSKQIDQVINSKWFGKNYPERIWSNTKALFQDIREELLINLVTGRTNREVDRKQYSDYKERLGKDLVPSNLSEFQDIKYSKSNEYGILKAQTKGMIYYNKAVQNEPSITAHVKDVARKSAMESAGLENRIKGKDSYLRKIRSKYDPNGNTYEVKDILRYTCTTSSNELAASALKAIETHRNMGYNTVEIKNYWINKYNPYNGINTTISAPNGQKFEVQYHTPESYAVKDQTHSLYGKWRLEPQGSEMAKELSRQMFGMTKGLIKPHNIEEIK